MLENGGVHPRILNLGSRCSYSLATVTHRYRSNRTLGGPQGRCGHFVEEKKSLIRAGI